MIKSSKKSMENVCKWRLASIIIAMTITNSVKVIIVWGMKLRWIMARVGVDETEISHQIVPIAFRSILVYSNRVVYTLGCVLFNQRDLSPDQTNNYITNTYMVASPNPHLSALTISIYLPSTYMYILCAILLYCVEYLNVCRW